jgi:ABC-type transporter Mla subunit MlaD
MEDEFELVSKAELIKLRENNSKPQLTETINKTNNKTKQVQTQEISKDILEQFRTIIKEENKIEKEQIISDLSNIKDLNKTTLSNVLERTDKLDTRIETLVQAISELVKTVHELVEDNSDNSKTDNTQIINEIKNLKLNDNSQEEIKQKLEQIDEFMNNLKILLSQIKPTQMSM